MVSSRVRVGAERLMFRRQLRRDSRAAPPATSKDDNNIFSLHDAPLDDAIRAVSFDFFDTLAVRRHLSLDQVFRKTAGLAADLVPGDRARVFRKVYGARGFAAGAMKRAMIRARSGDEPGLEAIFAQTLAPILPDPAHRSQVARQLVAAEAEIEARNLEPNPEALAAMRAIGATGRKVLITSDMYLPGWAMERIVAAMGFAPLVDSLFVSADCGVTKHGGGLYPVVAARTGLAPASILHIGDNWQSDVVSARAQGFRALHYHNAAWRSGERRLVRQGAMTKSDHLARDEMRRKYGMAAREPLTSLDAVVDQVIGPAAGFFVADILMAAARRQSSDVYFLTRDGTIFQDIAEAARARVPGLFGAGPRLRRLATSRATGELLKPPRLDAGQMIANTEYLMQGDFSLERLFTLFDLTPDAFAACPARLRDRIEGSLTETSPQPFRELLNDAPFRQVLKRRLSRKRADVLSYLAREGLFAAERPIFADIGYSGTWAKQLSALFEERVAAKARVPDCEFRFFASNRFFDGNLPALHPSVEMVPGFMLDHRDGPCLSASLNFSWLEPFFVDPSLGALGGFSGSRPGEPAFAPTGLTPAEYAVLAARRARIIGRAVAAIDDFFRYEGDLTTLRDILRERLVRLAERPHAGEVRAMNTLTHQRGMKTVARQPLARRLYPNRLPSKLAHLRDNDFWVQGCLSLSGLRFLGPLIGLAPAFGKIQNQEAAR